MNIVKSAFGHYETIGNPENADCVIGHSFGSGEVNIALAEFIGEYADDKPIIADRMLANTFARGDAQVDLVVEGPVSNTIGQGVGTWGVLLEAKIFMDQEGLNNPLMVAHAFHIGRVVMQAQKLGIEPIVPANLPSQFDRDSEQIRSRSALMWVPREIIGSLVLRAQDKL